MNNAQSRCVSEQGAQARPEGNVALKMFCTVIRLKWIVVWLVLCIHGFSGWGLLLGSAGLAQAVELVDASPVPSAEEFAAIRDAAEGGDAESQLYMGVFYANGNVVEQDYSVAAKWYAMAADRGNSTAKRNLALLFDCGIGVERDYRKAAALYQEAARMCEPAAFMGLARFAFTYSESLLPPAFESYNQLRLTALYLVVRNSSQKPLGKSIEENFWHFYYATQKFYQNDRNLVNEIRKCAEKKDGDAQLRLAVFIFQAQGTDVSKEEFQKWFTEAEKRDPRAKFAKNVTIYAGRTYSPLITEKPSPQRRQNLKEVCDSGLEQYYCFRYKFDQNEFSDLMSMAMNGYAPAAQALYMRYSLIQKKGKGLSDGEWYKIAYTNATKGDLYSMVFMVHLLLSGRGCLRNMEEALIWIALIVNYPDERGIIQLGRILAGKKEGIQPIGDEELNFLNQKANAGNVMAKIAMASYWRQLGDDSKANEWLESAVRDGSAPASYLLSMQYVSTDNDNATFIALQQQAINENYLPAMLNAFAMSTLRTDPSSSLSLLKNILSIGFSESAQSGCLAHLERNIQMGMTMGKVMQHEKNDYDFSSLMSPVISEFAKLYDNPLNEN